MEAIERLRDTVRIGEDYAVGAFKARIIVTSLVFFGFVISGITEHSITVALSSDRVPAEENGGINKTKVRRYCDPPNMTALVIYYDSSEEVKDYDDGYDFSQLQEMLFQDVFFKPRITSSDAKEWSGLISDSIQTKLTYEEYMEIVLKKSYLWGTLVSPIMSAQLVRNIGAKRVFGYSLLGSAAATLLVPAAWLTPSHLIIRFIQGFFNGAVIPACHTIGVNWFAPSFRSSFVSWYSGKYIGFAMTEVVTSLAVRSIGPNFIYYIIGLLTIVWFVLWSVLVYNTPEKNRNLSKAAKKQIMLEMGEDQSPTPSEIPWKHILCSRPVWMSIGVIFGSHCGQTTTNFAMRQYLKFVYNVSDSILSAVPFLIHSCFALLCGFTVDLIHKTQFVSVTSSRRMFVYISHFLPAGFIFVLSFVGCDVTAPILLYSLSIITSGAFYSGALCSAVDITPNFAGIVVGLCLTFGAAADVIIVYIVSQVLSGEVVGSWRITFSTTSLVLLITSIFFMLRGSGSVQQWNDLSKVKDGKGQGRDDALQANSDTASALPKIKNKVSVEEKILKVLHVQEPEKFTRVRAYSTSLPNENPKINPRIPQLKLDKKRASIS